MQSWDCSSCTFRHQAHAPRCVMCNELRVSRENMRDFIIGKSTTTTTTTSTSTHQPDSTSYPLVSIDNLVSNRSTAVETGLNSSVINNSENLPNQTHIPRTAQRPSTATISRNPYRSKPSKSSTSAVPIPISHPNTNNTNNASLHPPQQPSINVPPAVSHPSVPNQNLNPAIATNTAVASAQRIAPSTTNKRPSHSFIGNKLVPSNQKVRKRPKSLPKTIVLPYQPGTVPLANECADTWIYPVVAAYPKRQYQYDITCAAIQQNTLVSLPTGLGKTLIAAVVLYNFYRWYPTGKVLFLAPTLPLVDQQVQACYEIMGIPASDTALLTGKVPAVQRTTIWKERRVFFCTPQTVQRDLEANRCDALQVVCVVLDEAHKSTGEYAYCKVISHLEKAGAKFRIVGLSATPGTSIKAVQNVINVLRINCVEARSDNDPDVKQYIHDRQTDVVVVKGMDATKDVENKLNEIIGPLLDILRKRNVILPQFTDHKAISSYTLLKCQAFITSQPQNQRDNAAIGYLSAGICFLQIRTDLHKHGIGTVRSKLQKLQNDRPRGPLATIVKGDTFQALWNEVDNVSCNPNAVDNNLEAKYKNNPKLKKLCEILVDHFEKSKAASTSSRVIVFSQFRTSVSEIVDVLNESKPLIRARHFIGQGKSGGGTGTKATKQKIGGEQQQQLMDGMKQDEQKNVIARFKDGVYNTLVCTSIGEEGLDIGEVDLIVNFDCLSSPIRTIQRVGRTGRKREGRVVTLVAEGHEERTLARSIQNEKTLIHALKDPNSFEVAPIAPMLPTEPVVVEQDMAVAKIFHMSQVDGAQKQASKKRKQCSSTRPWELSETEEFQRSCILGKVSNNLPIFDFEHLRRRFLNARLISSSHSSKHSVLRGRMSSLIKSMESSYPLRIKPTIRATFKSTLKLNESSLEMSFPLIQPTLHSSIVPLYEKANYNSVTVTRKGAAIFAQQTLFNKSIHINGAGPRDSSVSVVRKKPQAGEIANLFRDDTSLAESTETISDKLVNEQEPSGISATPQDNIDVSDTLQTPHTSTKLVAIAKTTSCPTSSLQSDHILRSNAGRVRFSLDSGNLNETSLSFDSQQFFAPQNRKKSCRLAIDDTPESAAAMPLSTDCVSKIDTDLQDTQEIPSIDHFVCAICLANSVTTENPIILCDGPGHDIECDLVVHRNCYSAKCNMTEDKEWLCDRCHHIRDDGLVTMVKCRKCNKVNGVLKKLSDGLWEHFSCATRHLSIQNDCLLHRFSQPCQLNEAIPRPSPIHSDKSESPTALLREKKRRRKLVMQKFIDYEAEDSDMEDDGDLEELQIQAIEAEENELAGDFINDTSQLGFSPDDLDNLTLEQSPVNIDGTATTHRVLDMEREKALQFATPVLNRRMIQNRDTDEGSDDGSGPLYSSTAPDSTHGLGNMNFVRSVLEHHRQGGGTDEIETFYQEFVAEQKKVPAVSEATANTSNYKSETNEQ